MSEFDHTVATESTRGAQATGLAISSADREVLHTLAAQVAELAARPIEQEKRDLWYRHNALEPTRPVIFCDPEGSWKEIIPVDRWHARASLHGVGSFSSAARSFGAARCAMIV